MERLTSATRREFDRDGFFVVREFLSEAEVSQTIARLESFIESKLSQIPPHQVFYENKDDPKSLKQIQHLADHEASIASLANERLRRVAEFFLDGPVVAKNQQYFNKPPHTGCSTPPHQDGFYFMLNPCLAMTLWLALDAANESNGAVKYVRGSHLRGMRPHRQTRTLGFSQGIAEYPTQMDAENEVCIAANPGDLLIHDSLTIHLANENRSVSNRRALGFIYYSQRATEDVEAHEAYQKHLANQLKKTGKI